MSERKNSGTTSWNAEQVRRETGRKAEQKEKKAKKHKLGWLWYILGVLVASALLAGIAWLMVNDVCALNKEPLTATVEVERGDGINVVANKLKDAGLIESKLLFRIFGMIFSADEIITPGTYELHSGMDFRCLIQSMQTSLSIEPVGVVTVTIPEGYTCKQIFALLEEKGVCSAVELEDAAKNHVFDYDFVDNENLGSANRLEGYLAPDTYEFYENSAPEKALARLLDNFDYWMNEDMMQAVLESGYSLHEIITMASLIEKESVGDDAERRNISSVIHNRLERPTAETGRVLQLCSTVYYAMELKGVDVFDTTIDSEYNTYINGGMPPGPICCPGMSAIRAAVDPADTNYQFFALGQDNVSHFFTNYSDHLNFVNSSMYKPVG